MWSYAPFCCLCLMTVWLDYSASRAPFMHRATLQCSPVLHAPLFSPDALHNPLYSPALAPKVERCWLQLCSKAPSSSSLVEGIATLVHQIESTLGGLQEQHREEYAGLLQEELRLTNELEAFLSSVEEYRPAAAASRGPPKAPQHSGAQGSHSRCGTFRRRHPPFWGEYWRGWQHPE